MNSNVGSMLYPIVSIIRERELIAILRKYYGRKTIKRYPDSKCYCLDKIFVPESLCVLTNAAAQILAQDLHIFDHCNNILKEPDTNVVHYELESVPSRIISSYKL